MRPDVDASELARRLIAISDGLTLRVLGHDLSATEALRSIDRALNDQLDVVREASRDERVPHSA